MSYLTTEIRQLEVSDQLRHVCILNYNEFIIPDESNMEDTREAGEAAYLQLVNEYLSIRGIETEPNGCIITDTSPISEHITQSILDQWFSLAASDDIQSQKELYHLFRRPMFQITVLPGFDAQYLAEMTKALNPEANPSYVVGTTEEALDLAADLFTISNRRS